MSVHVRVDFSRLRGRNSVFLVIPIVLRAMVPLSAIVTLVTQQHTSSTTPATQLAPPTTQMSPFPADSASAVPPTA